MKAKVRDIGVMPPNVKSWSSLMRKTKFGNESLGPVNTILANWNNNKTQQIAWKILIVLYKLPN